MGKENQTENIDNIDTASMDYFNKKYKIYAIIACCFSVVLYTVIPFFASRNSINEQLLLVLVSIPPIVVVVVYRAVKLKVKTNFTQQFGKSLGFTFSPSAEMFTVSGQIFSFGDERTISDVLSGSFQGQPSRIFSYSCKMNGGESQVVYELTVFEVIIPSIVPDIVLSSVSSGYFTFTSGRKKIELEGDFNKYFTLTVPQGNEFEVYQVFTPDVMSILIDKASNLNFEFNEKKLYVYVPYNITTKKELQTMLDLFEYLISVFSKNIRAITV